MFDEQRDAGLRPFIERNVHRVKARRFEFQLLDVHDEIARAEMGIARQRYLHRNRDRRHDGPAVGVHEIEPHVVGALVLVAERHAQSDGTLRMNGRQLLGVNRIESPEQTQLPVVVRRRITQDCYLDVHSRTMKT